MIAWPFALAKLTGELFEEAFANQAAHDGADGAAIGETVFPEIGKEAVTCDDFLGIHGGEEGERFSGFGEGPLDRGKIVFLDKGDAIVAAVFFGGFGHGLH